MRAAVSTERARSGGDAFAGRAAQPRALPASTAPAQVVCHFPIKATEGLYCRQQAVPFSQTRHRQRKATPARLEKGAYAVRSTTRNRPRISTTATAKGRSARKTTTLVALPHTRPDWRPADDQHIYKNNNSQDYAKAVCDHFVQLGARGVCILFLSGH